MAAVNFDNATLDVNSSVIYKPMTSSSYLLINESAYLFDANGSSIVTSPTKGILSNTPSKVSILCSGTFGASGTELYLDRYRIWKVTDISFSSGDSYGFVVDIEINGNS